MVVWLFCCSTSSTFFPRVLVQRGPFIVDVRNTSFVPNDTRGIVRNAASSFETDEVSGLAKHLSRDYIVRLCRKVIRSVSRIEAGEIQSSTTTYGNAIPMAHREHTILFSYLQFGASIPCLQLASEQKLLAESRLSAKNTDAIANYGDKDSTSIADSASNLLIARKVGKTRRAEKTFCQA